MTFDYSGLKTTAEKLLAKFGKAATLTQRADSGDAWNPTTAYTETPVIVVERTVRKSPRESEAQITGTYYMSTSAGVSPAINDVLTVDGLAATVVEPRALQPGDTVILWEVSVSATPN
jgi:hypothetical protein